MFTLRLSSVVLLSSLLAVGCDSDKAEGDKAQPKAAAAAKATTPAPDKPAAESPAVVAKADADADHNGCIYAEGEKGTDPSCPHGKADGEAGEPQGPATGEGHYGTPFSEADAKPLPLGQVLAAAEPPAGSVLVTGEVEAVCKKKGCWMVVKDGENSARVLMKDHGFAVPMDCRGKKATIEGTLASRTFNEAQVKHLQKDGGGDPSEVSGERTEHVLTASGILIQS
ncbi:MAG: DUF4920 domain-containing protein [Deltaproteobacteria bacterium]|nr:DUF4920 domain-containing protein [Deltaproteobacteria bacterium]